MALFLALFGYGCNIITMLLLIPSKPTTFLNVRPRVSGSPPKPDSQSARAGLPRKFVVIQISVIGEYDKEMAQFMNYDVFSLNNPK